MAQVQICETVTGARMSELRARRDAAADADLVELRLDGVADPDVAGALQGRRTPVIVTCRPSWDGGRFEGSEEERLNLLSRAFEAGADFVDVEARADLGRVAGLDRSRLVLSFHDWLGVPADLPDRLRAMRGCGPAVVKIAVTARRLADCLPLLGAAAGFAGERLALIAMGERGQLTRTCPWLFGSCWTYAGRAAPGQLPARTLVERFRVRQGGAATAVYGIAGRPLGQSASVAMHNAAFGSAGLDAVYVSLESDAGAEVDEVAAALDVRGLSVTAPLKRELFAMASTADDLSARLGAANTLRRTDRGWEARNFDVPGFLAPLDAQGWVLADRPVVVLGAGGAARAAVAALQQRGARVSVSARRAGQARELAAALGVRADTWPPAPGWHTLVNTTPVGTWPDVDCTPIPGSALTGRLVYDLVYNPPDTALVRAARAAGLSAIGGLPMLVHQAGLQFEWWTGRPAPRDLLFREALRFVTEEGGQPDDADDV